MKDKPPFTLVIANSKGGVGKTTTAVALAHLLAEETNQSTLLLDLDPQASAKTWQLTSAETRNPVKCNVEQIGGDVPATRLPRKINDLAVGVEWLIIDTPPGDLERTDAAIETASTYGGSVVIPTSPSPLDLPRAVVTLEDIENRVPVYIVLIKARAGTNAITKAREQFKQLNAPVLKSEIPLREYISNAPLNGPAELLHPYRPVVAELLERLTK